MTGDLNSDAILPPEVTLEILSRVSAIKSVIKCKIVCKLWRDLIESQYFEESYSSKHHPHLFVSQPNYRINSKSSYKIIEFVCENGAPDVAVKFHLPVNTTVHSSVNGLVLLCGHNFFSNSIFLCNPITREYVRLPNPPRSMWTSWNVGFGVSRRSGTYKIVRISQHVNECVIYTLGTGQWRTVAGGAPPSLQYDTSCAFVNGNLYWLVCALNSKKPQISCFDLETEVFSSVPGPPCLDTPECYYKILCALGDRLCFCDDSTFIKSAVIWLMREDGCWTKKFVVKMPHIIGGGYTFPIKSFQDGRMLMCDMEIGEVFHYSKKTKSVHTYDLSQCISNIALYTPNFFPSISNIALYTPNFFPLKTLAIGIEEDVQSFEYSTNC